MGFFGGNGLLNPSKLTIQYTWSRNILRDSDTTEWTPGKNLLWESWIPCDLILHIMAKIQYKTGILQALEQAAEATSWEFNSRNVANTLWAYATMRARPGERIMRQLERQVEAISGEFNSQAVANTLWAFATSVCSSSPSPYIFFGTKARRFHWRQLCNNMVAIFEIAPCSHNLNVTDLVYASNLPVLDIFTVLCGFANTGLTRNLIFVRI